MNNDTTIFKLEDLGIDLTISHTIKVKSKKDNSTSSFSNTINYEPSVEEAEE